MSDLKTPANLQRKSLPHVADTDAVESALEVVTPPGHLPRQSAPHLEHVAAQSQAARAREAAKAAAAMGQILLSPLTMAQQPFKASEQSLLAQRFTAHSLGRLQSQKDFALSAAVFAEQPLRASLEKLRLPPVKAGPSRPHSATAPITVDELSTTTTGNLKVLSPADLDVAVRLIPSPPRSPSPPQGAHHHKTGPLLSDQLLCVNRPESVRTGVDAVHFFHNHSDNQGRDGLFVFCNLRKADPWEYCPYDLVAVDQAQVDPEHFVISATGVTHMHGNAADAGNAVTPLHTWLRQSYHFKLLRELTFFKKFAMVKAWVKWKLKHRRDKFQRRAQYLEAYHPMLNEWFAPTMRAIASDFGTLKNGATGIWERVGLGWLPASVAYSLKKVAVEQPAVTQQSVADGRLHIVLRLAFIGHENMLHLMRDFMQIRSVMRDTVASAMDLLSSRSAERMQRLGEDVKAELRDAFPEELNRTALRDIAFTRPNPRERWMKKSLAVRKHVHLTAMERYERALFHARLISRALRLADCMLMEAMADLAHCGITIAMSQLTTEPVTDSHSAHVRFAYKNGLWLVRGELLPKSARKDTHTVLHMVPSQQELSQTVGSTIREIAGMIGTTSRPFFLPAVQRLCHPFLADQESVPEPPTLLKFADLVAIHLDIAKLQIEAEELLCRQYNAALRTEKLRVFENVGELFLFAKAFKIEAYTAAKPSSEDIMTDMTVLRSWVQELSEVRPVVLLELMHFDLNALRNDMLDVAKNALQAFMRLGRESMYEKCMEQQQEIVTVLNGIDDKKFPSELFAFVAWLDSFGDHFAGRVPAHKRVVAEVGGIQKLHAVMLEEQASLSAQHAQLVKESDASSTKVARVRKDQEQLTLAMDAYASLARYMKSYTAQCTRAGDFYTASLPIMGVKVEKTVSMHLATIRDFLRDVRCGEIADPAQRPQQMKIAIVRYQNDLAAIKVQAMRLQKTQELLSLSAKSGTACLSLMDQVAQVNAFLDSRLRVWGELQKWARFTTSFNELTMLVQEVQRRRIENALEALNAEIQSWEHQAMTTDVMDFWRLTETELAMAQRMRVVHDSWKRGLGYLDLLLDPVFTVKHRVLLLDELANLEPNLGNATQQHALFWLGEVPAEEEAADEEALEDEDDDDGQVDETKEASSPQAAVHAVTFALTLGKHAAERTQASTDRQMKLLTSNLEVSHRASHRVLSRKRLWRVLLLLVVSSAVQAAAKRLYSSAQEESNIHQRLQWLQNHIAGLRICLSKRRKYGCLLLTNIEELQHTIVETMEHVTSIRGQQNTVNLREEYERVEMLLNRVSNVLRVTNETQVTWLYLSKILSEEKTRKLITYDLKPFSEVMTRWHGMQIQLQDGKDGLLDATAPNGPLATCKDMLAIMHSLEVQLGELYTNMRNTFPRFHLLSDTDILTALANAHSPFNLPQRIVSTCFPEVHTFIAAADDDGDDIVVTGVRSKGGDVLKLVHPISTKDTPIHEWFAHALVSLRSSLRAHTQACLSSVASVESALWEASFSQQCVLLVDSMVFVNAVERALLEVGSGARPAAMRTLSERTAVRLETLTQKLRTGSGPESNSSTSNTSSEQAARSSATPASQSGASDQPVAMTKAETSSGEEDGDGDGGRSQAQRRTLEMLTMLGVAHRDVAAEVVAEAASSPADWAWHRHLRHYWREDTNDCHVAVGDVRIAYGWEYGAALTAREQITLALTDRTLTTTAMALRHGGVIAMQPMHRALGFPISTYTSALAATFGRLLVSVDCTTNMDSLHVARVVQGIVDLNAWGAISGLEALGPHRLSFLSELTHNIQVAIAARKASVTAANVEFRLDHQATLLDPDALPFALMLAMPTRAAMVALPPDTRRPLNDFVKWRARRVALLQADLKAVFEATLRLQGMKRVSDAATALSTILRYVDKQTPAHLTYFRHELCAPTLLRWFREHAGELRGCDAVEVAQEALMALVATMPAEFADLTANLALDVFKPMLEDADDKEAYDADTFIPPEKGPSAAHKLLLVRLQSPEVVQATLPRLDRSAHELLDRVSSASQEGEEDEGERDFAVMRRMRTQELKVSPSEHAPALAADTGNLFDAGKESWLLGLGKQYHERNFMPEVVMQNVDNLEALLQERMSVLLVGPPGSGKSVTWQLLKTSLNKIATQKAAAEGAAEQAIVNSIESRHVYLHALSDEQLFGENGPDNTVVMSGGLVQSLLRPLEPRHAALRATMAAKGDAAPEWSEPEAPCGLAWTIFDGPLTGGNADRVLPMLREQTIWMNTLMRMRPSEGQRLLWECSDIHHAPPSLLSYAGLCWFQDPCVDAYVLLASDLDELVATCGLINEDTVARLCAQLAEALRDGYMNQRVGAANPLDESLWVQRVLRCFRPLVIGICSATLLAWDAARLQVPHAPDTHERITEMCVVFAMAWAMRSAADLRSDEDAREMEHLVRNAMAVAGIDTLPENGSLWDACIDAATTSWTTWDRSLLMPANALMTQRPSDVVPGQEVISLLYPTPTVQSMQTLMAAIVSAEGSALVLSRHAPDLEPVLYAFHNWPIPCIDEEQLQHVRMGCSGALDPASAHAILEGCLEKRRSTLLRGLLGKRVFLLVEDVHVSLSNSPLSATSPIVELARSLLDRSAFTEASEGQLCRIPDLSLLLTGVTKDVPKKPAAFQRFRRHVPFLQILASPMLTVFSADDRELVCKMVDTTLGCLAGVVDCAAEVKTSSKIAAFLCQIIKESAQVAVEGHGLARFDVNAVRKILKRVYTDLTQVPADFVADAVQTAKITDKLSGKAMLNLFGSVVSEDSLDSAGLFEQGKSASDLFGSLVAGKPKNKVLAGEVDMTWGVSDALRAEHVWLLLSSEICKELAVSVPLEALEGLRRIVTLSVAAQLRDLLLYYRSIVGTEQLAVEGAAKAMLQQSGLQLYTDVVTGERKIVSVWEDQGKTQKAVDKATLMKSLGKHAKAKTVDVVTAKTVFQMSRLLSELKEADVDKLVVCAVMHGVLTQIDGPDPDRRHVLPIQVELFQALLLKQLADRDEEIMEQLNAYNTWIQGEHTRLMSTLTDQSSIDRWPTLPFPPLSALLAPASAATVDQQAGTLPGHASIESSATQQTQPPHAPHKPLNSDVILVYRATKFCSDLEFVAQVADVVTVLRRPFLLAGCVLQAHAALGGDEMAYCAALHMRLAPRMLAPAPTLTPEEIATKVIGEILMATLRVLTSGRGELLIVSGQLVMEPAVLLLLHYYLQHCTIHPFVTESSVLAAFGTNPETLVQIGRVLAPGLDMSKVFPNLGIPSTALRTQSDDEEEDDAAQHTRKALKGVLARRRGANKPAEDVEEEPKGRLPPRRHNFSGRSVNESTHAPWQIFKLALQESMWQASALMRVCMTLSPTQMDRMSLTCPALLRRCTCIRFGDKADRLRLFACQHLIMREGRHVLKPWHDDASSTTAEADSALGTQAISARTLLEHTVEGSASGLSFVSAVVPVVPIKLVGAGAVTEEERQASAADSGAPLTYTSVVARSVSRPVRAGQQITLELAATMQSLLLSCSKVGMRMHDVAAEMLAKSCGHHGMALVCEHSRMSSFLEALHEIHSRQRKLLRTEHSHLRHFLSLLKSLSATRKELMEDVRKKSDENTALQQNTSAEKERLSVMEGRAAQLKTACADLALQKEIASQAVEKVKAKAKHDTAEIKMSYQAAVKKVVKLMERDVDELRSYNRPPAVVESVFAAVCLALGFPPEWENAVALLNDSEVPLMERISQFDVASIKLTRLSQLQRYTTSEDLDLARVRVVSRATHCFASWVHAVSDHAKIDAIKRWERARLTEILDSANSNQALLDKKGEELKELQDEIQTLQEVLTRKKHSVLRSGNIVRTEEHQIEVLEDTLINLREHIDALKARMDTLGNGLARLLGDSMLCAAMTTYGGMMPWGVKLEAVAAWKGVLAGHAIEHDAAWSMVRFMESTKRQHVLLPKSVIMDETMQTSLYIFAMSSAVPLLLDVEGEGLAVIRNVHEQNHGGAWLQLQSHSPTVIDEALSAVAGGASVAIEVSQLAGLETVIIQLRRRLELSRGATSNRLFFYTKLQEAWPASVQAFANLVSFSIGRNAVRQRLLSAFYAITDPGLEAMRRGQHAIANSLTTEYSDTTSSLLKFTAPLQSNCWLDSQLSAIVLRKLQDMSSILHQRNECESRIAQIGQAGASLDAIVNVAEAFWAALNDLGRCQSSFDVPFFHVLVMLRQAFKEKLTEGELQKQAMYRQHVVDSVAMNDSSDDDEDADGAAPDATRAGRGTPAQGDQKGEQGKGKEQPAKAKTALEIALEQGPLLNVNSKVRRFEGRMLVNEDAFRSAVLDKVSLWLDRDPTRLFAVLFRLRSEEIERRSCEGESSCAARVKLLFDVLLQRCPALLVPAQLRQGDRAAAAEAAAARARPRTHSRKQSSAGETSAPMGKPVQLSANVVAGLWAGGGDEDDDADNDAAFDALQLGEAPSLRADTSEIVIDLPERVTAPARPVTPLAPVVASRSLSRADASLGDAATLWLDNTRLDALVQLEVGEPSLEGLVDAVCASPHAWFDAAMAAQPWNAVPAPYRNAPEAARLLLTIVLDPARFGDAIEWFADAELSSFETSHSASRALQALQTLPTVNVAVLHSTRPMDVVGEVQLVLMMLNEGVHKLDLLSNSVVGSLAKEADARTPRSPNRSLRVTHLSRHTRIVALLPLLNAAAEGGDWLLALNAHLCPPLIPQIVDHLHMLQLAGDIAPGFKLLLYVPTQQLAAVPMRQQLQTVMLGRNHAIHPRVMHAMQSLVLDRNLRAAGSLGVFGVVPAEDASVMLSPKTLGVFQKLLLGLVLTMATIGQAAQDSAGVLGVSRSGRDAADLVDVSHAAHALRELVRQSSSTRAQPFSQLQAAILQTGFEVSHGSSLLLRTASQVVQQLFVPGMFRQSYPLRAVMLAPNGTFQEREMDLGPDDKAPLLTDLSTFVVHTSAVLKTGTLRPHVLLDVHIPPATLSPLHRATQSEEAMRFMTLDCSARLLQGCSASQRFLNETHVLFTELRALRNTARELYATARKAVKMLTSTLGLRSAFRRSKLQDMAQYFRGLIGGGASSSHASGLHGPEHDSDADSDEPSPRATASRGSAHGKDADQALPDDDRQRQPRLTGHASRDSVPALRSPRSAALARRASRQSLEFAGPAARRASRVIEDAAASAAVVRRASRASFQADVQSDVPTDADGAESEAADSVKELETGTSAAPSGQRSLGGVGKVTRYRSSVSKAVRPMMSLASSKFVAAINIGADPDDDLFDPGRKHGERATRDQAANGKSPDQRTGNWQSTGHYGRLVSGSVTFGAVQPSLGDEDAADFGLGHRPRSLTDNAIPGLQRRATKSSLAPSTYGSSAHAAQTAAKARRKSNRRTSVMFHDVDESPSLVTGAFDAIWTDSQAVGLLDRYKTGNVAYNEAPEDATRSGRPRDSNASSARSSVAPKSPEAPGAEVAASPSIFNMMLESQGVQGGVHSDGPNAAGAPAPVAKRLLKCRSTLHTRLEELDQRRRKSSGQTSTSGVLFAEVQREHTKMVGECLLQEVDKLIRELDAATDTVERIHDCLLSGEAMPVSMDALMRALAAGVVPQEWAGGIEDWIRSAPEAATSTRAYQRFALQHSAVTAWLRSVQLRLEHLEALCEVAPMERVWQLGLLDQPTAVVAAFERAYAMQYQHCLHQVTSRASVTSGEEPDFVLRARLPETVGFVQKHGECRPLTTDHAAAQNESMWRAINFLNEQQLVCKHDVQQCIGVTPCIEAPGSPRRRAVSSSLNASLTQNLLAVRLTHAFRAELPWCGGSGVVSDGDDADVDTMPLVALDSETPPALWHLTCAAWLSQASIQSSAL